MWYALLYVYTYIQNIPHATSVGAWCACLRDGCEIISPQPPSTHHATHTNGNDVCLPPPPLCHLWEITLPQEAMRCGWCCRVIHVYQRKPLALRVGVVVLLLLSNELPPPYQPSRVCVWSVVLCVVCTLCVCVCVCIAVVVIHFHTPHHTCIQHPHGHGQTCVSPGQPTHPSDT